MEANTPVLTEEELEKVFRQDPDRGVMLLHEGYRDAIARYIKHISRSQLSQDELRDCYQETMIAVIKRARSPDFRPERPLGLVFRIARCRALDALRRARKHRPATAKLDEEAGSGVAGLEELERAELKAALCEIIASLPSRQRLVVDTFARNIEAISERKKYELIIAAIKERTGDDITLFSAKSAWRAARDTLRKKLLERGFDKKTPSERGQHEQA